MPAISVQNLKYSYYNDEHNVIDDISFEVNEGDLVSLIGLNGIGKTTTIKSILSLFHVNHGSINIYGIDNKIAFSRSKLAYLPEKFTPAHNLSGIDFLSLTLSFYDKKFNLSEARLLCEELDLDPEALSRNISSYSKGMAQKLGLISVFMANVPLLILDEPMSGLDPKSRIALKKKLKAHVANGYNSVLFSSHIMADIEEICSKVIALHCGKIIYTGSVADFLTQYDSADLEIALLKAINQGF